MAVRRSVATAGDQGALPHMLLPPPGGSSSCPGGGGGAVPSADMSRLLRVAFLHMLSSVSSINVRVALGFLSCLGMGRTANAYDHPRLHSGGT